MLTQVKKEKKLKRKKFHSFSFFKFPAQDAATLVQVSSTTFVLFLTTRVKNGTRLYDVPADASTHNFTHLLPTTTFPANFKIQKLLNERLETMNEKKVPLNKNRKNAFSPHFAFPFMHASGKLARFMDTTD